MIYLDLIALERPTRIVSPRGAGWEPVSLDEKQSQINPNQTATWAKGRFAGVAYVLRAHFVPSVGLHGQTLWVRKFRRRHRKRSFRHKALKTFIISAIIVLGDHIASCQLILTIWISILPSLSIRHVLRPILRASRLRTRPTFTCSFACV